MADFNPEDLSREIGKLWERVSSTPTQTLSASTVTATEAAGTTMGAEAAWETVALLKRQARQREDSWRQTMEARDEALRTLRARLESSEAELGRLRLRAENEDERVLVESLAAAEKVEGAQKAMALERERQEEERRVLEAAMQSLRERFAAETGRARTAEQRWQAREQQYLLDLKEIQGLAARRESEAAAAEKEVRVRDASLAEAKNALQKTLAELMLERKESERAQGEREAAVKKVEELRAHVDELSRIWEEERAQWRELWDRERSTWETQRGELAHWEETLRREREAWHAELKVKEKTHLELTEDLSGKIRETSRNAEKMSELISLYDQRSEAVAEGSLAEAARARARAKTRRRWLAAAVAAIALAAGAGPAWRAAVVWRFVPETVSPAPTANPSALAYDGASLWVADWDGTLTAVDPADPRHVRLQALPKPGGPYRPTALAAGGGLLWTLDAAQARLLRHSATEPDHIIAARPSPGPAPTALAYDGETAWSYDAVSRTLTRHAGDDSPAQTFSLPDDAVPNAMTWIDGRLWIHDAKGRRLLIYAVADGKLKRVGFQPEPEPGVIGMAATGSGEDRAMDLLLGPSGARASAQIVRYRLRRFFLFRFFNNLVTRFKRA